MANYIFFSKSFKNRIFTFKRLDTDMDLFPFLVLIDRAGYFAQYFIANEWRTTEARYFSEIGIVLSELGKFLRDCF